MLSAHTHHPNPQQQCIKDLQAQLMHCTHAPRPITLKATFFAIGTSTRGSIQSANPFKQSPWELVAYIFTHNMFAGDAQKSQKKTVALHYSNSLTFLNI